MVQVGDLTIQDAAKILPETFVSFFQRTNTDADGSQAVTGVGFTPSRVIFFANIADTGSVSLTVNGFLSASIVSQGVRNLHEETADDWTGTTVSVSMVTTTATENNATLTSFDTDGFTVSWVKAGSPTGTTTIRFMAIK